MKSFVAFAVVLAVSSFGVLAAPQVFQNGPPTPIQNILNLIPFRPFQMQQQLQQQQVAAVATVADPNNNVVAPAVLPAGPQNPLAQFFQFQQPLNGWFQLPILPNLFPNLFPNNQNNGAMAVAGQEQPTIIFVARPPPQQQQPQQPAAVASQEEDTSAGALAEIDAADVPTQATATATINAAANLNSTPNTCKYLSYQLYRSRAGFLTD